MSYDWCSVGEWLNGSPTTLFVAVVSIAAETPKPNHITILGRGVVSPPLLHLGSALAKPPNYKQQKQRREDMQKKRNEAKQREQVARKENNHLPQKP